MTLDDLRYFFETTDKYLLTTHESPDGDGLGAQYALCAGLLDSGKDAVILNADAHAAKYEFLDERNLINTYENSGSFPEDLSERVLVVLDTHSENIGEMGTVLRRDCLNTITIDHHSPEGSYKGETWLMPESSSTCEMVFRLIEELGIPLKPDVAVALYTGIVYDTGSFIYPKTQAGTFRIAEVLVAGGAVPNDVFTHLYENKSKAALILQSLVTGTMALHLNDHAAIQQMPRETLIESGAHFDESQEIVNIPLQCGDVRVSVFFKESETGIRHCSMRSKGEVDCAAIAHRFGGGGHRTAAGFRFEVDFEEIEELVLESMRPYFT